MNCDYCDEMHGLETAYSRIYGAKSRIVRETKSFLVFPCMGQLRAGHLLIVSKAHKNAIGLLDEDTIKELDALVSEIAGFFQKTYQRDLLCFEHGVLDDHGTNGGCGISHMHLHLLPANQQEFLSAAELVQSNRTNVVCPAQGLLDTRHCVVNGKTYIFFSFLRHRQKQDSFIITSNNNSFESQYMRKIICRTIGKAEWDWRQIKAPEPELLSTFEKSYAFFVIQK